MNYQININDKINWTSRPKEAGFCLVKYPDDTVEIVLIHSIDSEFGPRIIAGPGDDESISHPHYKGCKWSEPITVSNPEAHIKK